MEKESSIKELISNSLDQIRAIIDADTVVGKQMVTPSGTVIIPISKVSMGFASGGLDLPSEENDVKNFGGGGGTGLTVSPVGFLVCDKNGEVEFINVTSKGKPDPVDQIADLVERTPDIIAKIKALFVKEDLSDALLEDDE